MAAGLQVWDASGMLILDTNDITASVLGTFTIGGAGSAQSGSVSDPRVAQTEYVYPYYQLLSVQAGDQYALPLLPTITFSGGQVNWSFPQAGNYPVTRVLYGVA